MLHIDDCRAGRGDSAARRARRSAGEGDGAEVGERDEASALFEVLDDPLRVLLTERRLATEGVAHLLAGRVVNERSGSSRLRRRGHGGSDRVTRVDGEATEVERSGGEPFVPGYNKQASQ